MTPHEAVAVLAVFEKADDYESLIWRVTKTDAGMDVKLLSNCSDLFFWATADLEEIAADDVPLLEQCLADLRATGQTEYFPELFAARKRKLRPQKPCYKHMNEATTALFDACCTTQERAKADKEDAAFWLHVAHKARKGEL